MTVAEPASTYLVFVLEARDGAETSIISIRPETPEAAATIRTRVARIKEAWGVDHPVRIDLDGSRDQGLGRERAS
jgi:hypothetical protein